MGAVQQCLHGERVDMSMKWLLNVVIFESALRGCPMEPTKNTSSQNQRVEQHTSMHTAIEKEHVQDENAENDTRRFTKAGLPTAFILITYLL